MSVKRLHKQEKIQTEIKIIDESIGFFCASASIVDFGPTMGHGIIVYNLVTIGRLRIDPRRLRTAGRRRNDSFAKRPVTYFNDTCY